MAQSRISWPFRRRAPLSAQEQTQARIDRKLRAIERQGSGQAIFAHGLAYLLVVAFSAGSLVALAGDAIRTFITQAQHGVLDVPSLISFIVSFTLVFAMDTAMVIASVTVRMLRQRHQDGEGIHIAMIVGVCLVESATYLYMSYVYDHPVGWVAWTILTARAVAAPIMAVYLSLARTLPISARDINTQVESVTGRGVLVEMTRIADDPSATTERKVALYRASAIMDDVDKSRLDAILDAERTTREHAPSAMTITERPLPPAGGPNGAGNGGSPSRLNSATRRAAIERDMLTARAYDLDTDDSGGWSARNDGADEFDMDFDDGEIARPSHPTRPRSSDRAPTARLSTLARELVTDLPTGKSEHAGDTPEAKRVMRYLDRHPGAKIADVISGAKVGRSTARRYYTAWLERNKRMGEDPAPFTEEMDAVTPAMLGNAR